MIQFFKGNSEKYNAELHGEGIYFTDDTNEILTNDQSFGKNADQSKTTLDIIIAGGPLANNIVESKDVWPTEWVKDGNKIIPSGTSVQDVLLGLFLKTENGTVTWGTKTWSPSLGVPTVTLSSNGPVEIGSTVTCTVTANTKVSNNKRSSTCTATQGHFTSLDGSWVSGNKTVSVDGTTSGSVSLTHYWNNNVVSNFVSNSTTLKIASGTNTFKVDQSGITASVNALPSTTVYASTNTKSILSNVSATLTDTKPEDKPLTSTNNDTITGSYKYFYGQMSGTGITLDSAKVRALPNSGFVCNIGAADVLTSITVSANGNTYFIAVPEGYTITNILALGEDAKGAWTNEGQPKATVSVKLPDNSEKTYNIFYCENVGPADAKFTNLKLG